MKLSRIQNVLSATLLTVAVSAGGQVAPPLSPAASSTLGGPNSAPVNVPALDVISVKPNKSGSRGMSMGPMSATNVPVHLLLTQAYHLYDDQLIGEPAWAKTDRFDVNGKVAASDEATVAKLTQEQKRVFFQQMLKERFGLVVHHETRELPEYALVVAKGGAKIEEGKPDTSSPADNRIHGGSRMSMERGRMKFEDGGDGLDFLLQILSSQTGRAVVNKTGLTGKYSFTLTWSPQMGAEMPRGGAEGEASAATDTAPDLFTAIQEQLGLKLEPMKGPVDVVVIDHIERPGEN